MTTTVATAAPAAVQDQFVEAENAATTRRQRHDDPDRQCAHPRPALPNARVRIFDDAGHGFLFQRSVDYARLVDEFRG